MSGEFKKIESLTPEQEAAMERYRDMGLKIGLATSTGPLDQALVEKLMAGVFENQGEKAPQHVYCVESPMAAYKFMKENLCPELDGMPYTHFGQHDINWLIFYAFFHFECGVPGLEKVLPLLEAAKHLGWYWTSLEEGGVAVVSNRPRELHRDTENRLHNENGPAVVYGDGFKLYFSHGVSFNGNDMERFIDTPADQLNPEEILKIGNVEQRAEMIKKYGIGKLFDKLKPTKLDSKTVEDGSGVKHPYSLYRVKIGENDRIYLRMENPSIEETHIEAVHPDCKTVTDALSWRNMGTIQAFTPPVALT